MEKVSIILPVYNGASTLAEALDSVIQQSYSNWELIIVNDCSTDQTRQIAERYLNKDKRIMLINNEQNLKLPLSLNVGFAAATGQYLTWTSDDNMFLNNAIEEMVKVLDQNTEYGFVYCDYSVCDYNRNIVETRRVQPVRLLLYSNVIGACFMYRRKDAEKAGEYDPNMFLAEDYEYWLRLYQHTRFFPLHKNLYVYMEHPGSLTSTRRDEIRRITVEVYKKHIHFILGKSKRDNIYERNLMLDEICRYSRCRIMQVFQFAVTQKGYGIYYLKKIVKKMIHNK